MTTQPMPTNFTALDLLAWHEEGSLELSPKFQRRGVWKPAAKGFFLDTLLRGYPVPPLHIRMMPTAGTNRARREVIDGQQRLRTLFDFFEGKLRISRALHSPWAGKTIDEITDDEREILKLTQFHVYQYQAIDDQTVLEIFARLNTYSVALNAQELRNGKYFGEFKSLVYTLSWRYLELWRSSGIFSESGIARMAEAELVSEILVMQFDGLQDKKKSLEWFYAGLDETWPSVPTSIPAGRGGRTIAPKQWITKVEAEDRFQNTITQLVDSCGDLLKSSDFRRVAIFYTLYGVVYHALYGLPGQTGGALFEGFRPRDIAALRSGIEEFEQALRADALDETVPAWKRNLVVASSRQTDNIGPRRQRFDELWRLADLAR